MPHSGVSKWNATRHTAGSASTANKQETRVTVAIGLDLDLDFISFHFGSVDSSGLKWSHWPANGRVVWQCDGIETDRDQS